MHEKQKSQTHGINLSSLSQNAEAFSSRTDKTFAIKIKSSKTFYTCKIVVFHRVE